MKLCRQNEVPQDERGLLCRQSRLMGIVRLIVWCGVLAVFPVFGWKLSQPWLLWIGVAVAAVVIPMAVLDLAVMFRANNWLLRIVFDGVWINLRSYRDRSSVTDALSVMYLENAEIVSVGRHTEAYSTPTETATGPGNYGAVGGSTCWRDEFLEIQLNHDQTDELKTALNNLRNPASPNHPAPIRIRHYPVWLVSPSVIRIGWVSAHGHAVSPRLATALARLDGSVRLAEPTRRDRPDWRKLNAEQVDELAQELAQVHGATFEATALLVRAGGIPYNVANTQVQQFEAERK